MKKCSIERGVHTLELYLGQLSYADVDAMIEDLYDMAKKQKTPELIRQREKHPSPLKRSYEVHGYYPTDHSANLSTVPDPQCHSDHYQSQHLHLRVIYSRGVVPPKGVSRCVAEGSLPTG